MADPRSPNATNQHYQFKSVYPNLDAKGNIISYRVIMDGKVADVPASGKLISPRDPAYPTKPAVEVPTSSVNYKPSISELSTLGAQRRGCLCDLIAANELSKEAHDIAQDQNAISGQAFPHRPWALWGRDGWQEVAKETYLTSSPEDEFSNKLGAMSLQGYSALQEQAVSYNSMGSGTPGLNATSDPRIKESLQKSASIFHGLLKNEYALAMAPELIKAIQNRAEMEAKLFVGKTPREKEALSQNFPLGSLQLTAPLREAEVVKLQKYQAAHASIAQTLGAIGPIQAKKPESWGNEVLDHQANDKTLPFLTRAAQIQYVADRQVPRMGEAGIGVGVTAPLPYPPTGPGIAKHVEDLQQSKVTPKIVPVQIVGEPEYSSLAVDSSKGFVRRVAEEGGRKMVVVKEVEGVIQVSHEAQHRFDRTFGKPFNQESPKDKYGMLQLMANGGEADPKLVTTTWQKMSDSQKEVIEELKMGTPSTGVGIAIKSDAYSKFREASGREFDPQSGLDKINLANISSGRPQVSIEEWSRNPAEPARAAIPTLEAFEPAVTETAQVFEAAPVENIITNAMPTQAENIITETILPAQEAKAIPEEPKEANEQEEDKENPESDASNEEARMRKANAGQAAGEYMDTSVDIF